MSVEREELRAAQERAVAAVEAAARELDRAVGEARRLAVRWEPISEAAGIPTARAFETWGPDA